MTTQPSVETGSLHVPLLEVRNVSVNFGFADTEVTALHDISFTLERGQTRSILGESGSGKSVTALSVMGLVPPKSGRVVGGSVLLNGDNLRDLSPVAMRAVRGERVSMIFQDPLSSLNPVMTVGAQLGEMFRVHRGLSRKQARREAIALMDRVRIPSGKDRIDEYPHQFSGGMRQRVLIAIGIALDPEVLIADEPTTALDVTVQAQIMDLLAELQRENQMGLLLISHDLGQVAHVTDDVTVMYGGRIVESGPVKDVFQQPAHPYTQGLLASLPQSQHAGDRLTPIPGSPPNLFSLPSGCSFHPRCGYAQEICSTKLPMLQRVGGQLSACHFAEEVHRTGDSQP